MNFTQLRAFDAAAREGSFSRAAAALRVTQPALTIQVKALEEGYGVKLFQRHGRGVALTTEGQALFELTRRLFAIEEEAEELLDTSRALRRGHLRVAADGPHIVMGMFVRYLRRYPEVRLSVTLGNTHTVRRDLLEGRADVAILPGADREGSLLTVPLWRHTPVLIVPHAHRWARRRRIRLAEVDGEPMLMRERGSNTQRLLDAGLERAGARPRVVLEVGSREGVLGAVAAGLGVGMVWKVEAQGDRRFRLIDIVDEGLESVDFVACLRSERGRRVVRAMIEIAQTIHETGAVLETGPAFG